jgi:hypothetical protein
MMKERRIPFIPLVHKGTSPCLQKTKENKRTFAPIVTIYRINVLAFAAHAACPVPRGGMMNRPRLPLFPLSMTSSSCF